MASIKEEESAPEERRAALVWRFAKIESERGKKKPFCGTRNICTPREVVGLVPNLVNLKGLGSQSERKEGDCLLSRRSEKEEGKSYDSNRKEDSRPGFPIPKAGSERESAFCVQKTSAPDVAEERGREE